MLHAIVIVVKNQNGERVGIEYGDCDNEKGEGIHPLSLAQRAVQQLLVLVHNGNFVGDDCISSGDNWIAACMSVATGSLQGLHFDVERLSLVCQSASTSKQVECLSGIPGVLAFLSLNHEERQRLSFPCANPFCLSILVNIKNSERQKRNCQNDYQRDCWKRHLIPCWLKFR